MKSWKRFAALGLAVLGTFTAPGSAVAQTFPSQPVKIIVPWAPGGTADILGRQMGVELSQKWGVPVVIDNRPGASGTIGSDQLARSPANGYTLMLVATHHVINPSLMKTLPYDTRKDFTPISMVAAMPNVLVVNPALPVKNVQELIKYAKERPGKVSFGASGVGGASHIAGEMLGQLAGLDLVSVSYKGAAPALTDLLGGHIAMMFDSMPSMLPQIKSGKLRALGVTSLKRSPVLPDVPTIDESGVKGFQATPWFAMFAPGNMPADLTKKISGDVIDVIKSPRMQAWLAEQGADPMTMTQPEFAAFINNEFGKWGKVISAANIKVE
ncbi:MAG: tripartite tricarboxylate transporter substrate binding protein [Pseudomonadota bacterium]